MDTIGVVLRNRYEIIARIGTGGMSSVYLARDRMLDSLWAVKQMKNEHSEVPDAIKVEVELLSALAHPAIPRIVDRVAQGGHDYVVMDYIEGVSLGDIIREGGAADESDIVNWSKQLCDVLIYLHTRAARQPIIYCDLKPDNIMLTPSGRICLIDFGAARKPGAPDNQSAAIGTKGYAAPEQYLDGSRILDVRTDIYAFGATLFYLAFGHTPRSSPPNFLNPREISSTYSEGLGWIIQVCCQENPVERYLSFDQVLRDLCQIERLNRGCRRRMKRHLRLFIASLFVSLVAALCVFIGAEKMEINRREEYVRLLNWGKIAEQDGNRRAAAAHYHLAIGCEPDDHEAYVLLYQALLPEPTDEDFTAKTKEAIDELRKHYLDNRMSVKFQDPRLAWLIAKGCLKVNDPVYSSFALDYLAIIESSDLIIQGLPDDSEIKAYSLIASYLSDSVQKTDFALFSEALNQLEAVSASPSMRVDEQLENYFLLIRLYITYSNHLTDAWTRIDEIAEQAKTLIDEHQDSTDMAFDQIVDLYQTVASAQANRGLAAWDRDEKKKRFENSLKWFGCLDDLKVELNALSLVKKGDVLYALYELQDLDESSDFEQQSWKYELLNEAISCYEAATQTQPDSFQAHVNLTRSLIQKEEVHSRRRGDFTEVLEAFQKVEDIMNVKEGRLISIELNQYKSLKTQVERLCEED